MSLASVCLILHLITGYILSFSYRSDDMAPVRPLRRSWSEARLCSTSSGVLTKERHKIGLIKVNNEEHRLQHEVQNVTLRVSLKVSGQLHGENGVKEGGDEGSIQAAHGPEHLQQQQPQRHAMLLCGRTEATTSKDSVKSPLN